MFRTKPLTLLAITVLGCSVNEHCLGGIASRDNHPATVQVNYFANANTAGAPDGTVEMTNPVHRGGTPISVQ